MLVNSFPKFVNRLPHVVAATFTSEQIHYAGSCAVNIVFWLESLKLGRSMLFLMSMCWQYGQPPQEKVPSILHASPLLGWYSLLTTLSSTERALLNVTAGVLGTNWDKERSMVNKCQYLFRIRLNCLCCTEYVVMILLVSSVGASFCTLSRSRRDSLIVFL